MLSNLVSADSVSAYKHALGEIERDTPARFGTLDAHRMMTHLRLTFEASLGYTELRDRSKPIIRNILWFLLFRVFTNWPKGVFKTPRAFTVESEHDFESERALLLERIDEFVALAQAEPGRLATEPDFGTMPLKQWERFHGVHCKHHLKQFGAI